MLANYDLQLYRRAAPFVADNNDGTQRDNNLEAHFFKVVIIILVNIMYAILLRLVEIFCEILKAIF